MTHPLIEDTQEWFEKANHDLITAKAAKGVKVYDTAIFHCQQAAEKAVKGFLTYHDIKFEKDHNIVKHLKKAIAIEGSFELWEEAGRVLSPYAVMIRYPGNIVEVSPKAFAVAYRYAKGIYDHALSVLPKVVRPKRPPKKRRSKNGR